MECFSPKIKYPELAFGNSDDNPHKDCVNKEKKISCVGKIHATSHAQRLSQYPKRIISFQNFHSSLCLISDRNIRVFM